MTRVTGTPPSFSAVASGATLTALEYERVLDLVAGYAVSEGGAAAVRARTPSPAIADVREALATVDECVRLLGAGTAPAPEPAPDVDDALALLGKPGAPLDGEQLARLGRAAQAMRRVAAGLRRVTDDAPRVAALRVDVPSAALPERIEQALDPDGSVRDGADRDVDRARRDVQDTRRELVAHLERTLRDLDTHERPADAGVTVRDGRYVIPVLRDARGRLPGLVHDESASGATIFVEPATAVELGNRLTAAQAAERRAVHALLRRLTDEARPHAPAVAQGIGMLVSVDALHARAAWAADVDAHCPELVEAPGPHCLRNARHPLLLADGVETVPFDLVLGQDETGLVISGPNTGGKTVLLKTVGLASALAQAGFPPPLGPGSVLPVFRHIVADVGDRQSIAASLSTFSAHLASVRVALEVADAETLVLLDEVGTGTDPREGAALAAATLLTLVERRTRTVATTHLGALKDLAAETSGIVNASLQFDGETLTPTYRLLRDVPGRSYGLVMARRLGLPAEVVDRAEARVPEDARALDAVLAEVEQRAASLDERQAALDAAEARAERDRRDVERRTRELEELEETLRLRERELEREGRARARQFLLEARKRVEDALGMARAAVSEATAKEARRHVEEGIADEAAELERIEDRLKEKGWTVRLGRSSTPSAPSAPSAPPASPDPAGHRSGIAEQAASELDIRGFRVDEARLAVEQAIDAAVVADLPSLRVIHGKGTGALRQVVGEIAQRDRRVTAHRTAPSREGGHGVTVLELS